jgi:hypothetical protein
MITSWRNVSKDPVETFTPGMAQGCGHWQKRLRENRGEWFGS